MTYRQRLDELRAFVDLCFLALPDDLKEVSNLTGLHISTLYRLRRGGASLQCHYNTVTALGYAAGLKLTWTKSRARVRLITRR